jgi:hypothetical protein
MATMTSQTDYDLLELLPRSWLHALSQPWMLPPRARSDLFVLTKRSNAAAIPAEVEIGNCADWVTRQGGATQQ